MTLDHVKLDTEVILDHIELDTEVILDHIEMDTEVIKLIHVVKELLYSQDDHEIMIIWI